MFRSEVDQASAPREAPRSAASVSPSRLTIMAPTRYPFQFNSPKHTAHRIETRTYLPLNYISHAVEGTTLFNPLPLRRFDLIHTFNRIPWNRGRYIIGFESHLPRAFGVEHTAYFDAMTRSLLRDRCRGMVAISHWSARTFAAQHAGRSYWPELEAKLQVRYPNMIVPELDDPLEIGQEPLTLTFVGNHFARKGGCVALRVAEKALALDFPVKVVVVSKLQSGGGIWTDPTREGFDERYRALLKLPNVEFHQGLPNAAVLDLLRRTHLSLLPTLSDSFGYSAIESMMVYVPMVATRLQALQEFVLDGDTGVALDIETNPDGDWRQTNHPDRGSQDFVTRFHDVIEDLAERVLASVIALSQDREALRAMRRRARAKALELFDSRPASLWWDEYYAKSVAR